jgi:Acetyltransferase (GNAT) family
MAGSFHARTTVLLTANGVVAASRRLGIGSALARARLRDARTEGCEFAVLAPSPDGAKLYKALGFQSHVNRPIAGFTLRSRNAPSSDCCVDQARAPAPVLQNAARAKSKAGPAGYGWSSLRMSNSSSPN